MEAEMAISEQELEAIADMTAKELQVEASGYNIGGFTKPQRDMRYGFNREIEDALVKSCSREIGKIFGEPNKYEKRLAKMEGIPIDKPETKQLYNNIIYTDDPHYYCAGSGSIGGGKVFWTPYTSNDSDTKDKIMNEGLCDNCATLAHEDQHGIGAHAEFDDFSSIPSSSFRLKEFGEGNRLEGEIGSRFSRVGRACSTGYKERYERKDRNVICSLNERVPGKLKEALRYYGYNDNQIKDVLECACKNA